MKPKMTVDEKYEFILKKLSRKFPDAGQGGFVDGDGFSIDFSIPEGEQDVTLSIQVGADNEHQEGYVNGYVYANDGKIVLHAHELDYTSDEDFEAAVVRNHGFILRQARKYKEEAE
ncbi:hypothetical protein JMA_41160 (plasmid) [Jeotgalibacillus malaysiensis]|uniref:Uncharacterized protein n=1 Tax=Jeotgalibacillus malaysiensis TaxID=1508404 RepID=A0A0B5AY31_9BACL|nr:hypothetical protein [Jeotgalibacillus malaysiensis]AJD93433.1 hypothetical protein JMA_41160 [Jeotgalibacillus malaysiensis]